MCNISLPSNGTGSHHPGSGEGGWGWGQDRRFLVRRGDGEEQRP